VLARRDWREFTGSAGMPGDEKYRKKDKKKTDLLKSATRTVPGLTDLNYVFVKRGVVMPNGIFMLLLY
jgi:hypothetical protein